MYIVVLGDSLALPRPHDVRYYDPNNNEPMAVSYPQTYSARLSEWLTQVCPQEHIMVNNRAMRKTTMKHINIHFKDHLFWHEPDIIILHEGIVDLWPREELNGLPNVPIEEFEMLLMECIEKLRQRPKTKLIIIGVSPCDRRLEEKAPGIQENIQQYNKVLQRAANEPQTYYIDMTAHIILENSEQFLLPDGYHLSADGNELVFRLLKDTILPLL